MKLAARSTALRCAFCHDPLGGAVLTCLACRTLIHEECELDRCPTFGCGSYEPWELVGARRRRALAAWLVFVTGLSLAVAGATKQLVLSRAQVEVATPHPLPPETRPSPWLRFGVGSSLVVETRHEGVYHSSYVGAQVSIDQYWRWSSTEGRRHRLLFVGEHDVGVEVEQLDSLGRPCRRERGKQPLDLPEEATGELLEERDGVPVTVPAGVFVARYRRERGRHPGRIDEVVETWTDARLPVPIRRLATWRVPRAPSDIQVCTEDQRLRSIEARASAERLSSAWFLLESGAELVTRTTTTRSGRSFYPRRARERPEEPTWRRRTERGPPRHHLLVERLVDRVHLNLWASDRPGQRTDSQFVDVLCNATVLPAGPALVRRSGVVLTVPAGTFVCEYALQVDEDPTRWRGWPRVRETWWDPRLPLAIRTRVTTLSGCTSEPEHRQDVEETDLVSIQARATSEPFDRP